MSDKIESRGSLGTPPEPLGPVAPEWTSDNGYNGIRQDLALEELVQEQQSTIMKLRTTRPHLQELTTPVDV